jgi:methionyl-tRNA formyltransferase
MRIILMGQAPFGAKTLEALLGRGEEVIAVYTPTDERGKEDPLKTLAKERNLHIRQPVSYKDPDVFTDFKRFSPDLLIMAFVTVIIPTPFLDFPKYGAICYHPSFLPRHRGASGINWAIIMGDERTGLTIFWPDGGIDTGPILLQKEIFIKPDDTTGALYFNLLFPMGIEAILESVELIKKGKAPRIPQDESKGTYEPPCDEKVARIDWAKSGKQIYNLIRGCDPQPGAYSFWKDQKIHFYSTLFSPGGVENQAGEIIGLTGKHITVSTRDGVLEITKVKGPGLGKVEVPQFVSKTGIKVGDRFTG